MTVNNCKWPLRKQRGFFTHKVSTVSTSVWMTCFFAFFKFVPNSSNLFSLRTVLQIKIRFLHRAKKKEKEKEEEQRKRRKKTKNPISISYWEEKGQSVNNYLLNRHYMCSTGIEVYVWEKRKQKIVTIPHEELKI